MNEDYSNLIKNFSDILKEKNIDINNILNNSSTNNFKEPKLQDSSNNINNINFDKNNNNSTTNPLSNLDLNFDDILKIKKVLEKMNNSQNTARNTFLHSLEPLLPYNKKEKLEQLIKISTLLTALELFENKNFLGIDLNSNTILIIILILIIL